MDVIGRPVGLLVGAGGRHRAIEAAVRVLGARPDMPLVEMAVDVDQPGPDLACWDVQGGQWSVDEQKRLVCKLDGDQQRLLCHTDVFGEDYEFEGVVEFPNDTKFAPNGGPLFAHRDPVHSFGVILRRRAQQLSVAQGGAPLDPKSTELPDRCAFRIRELLGKEVR